MLKILTTILIAITIASCERNTDESKATAGEGFSIVSAVEAKIANDAKAEDILAQDGSVRAVAVTARDSSYPIYLICECPAPGCGGNCNSTRDPPGSNNLLCTGSCSNSEGLTCGQCVYRRSETPPSAMDLRENLGVDPTDEPPLETSPN